MNDIDFDALCTKPAGQPESIATSLVGDDDAGDLVAGLDSFVAPAMKQPQQGMRISRELLQRIAVNARNDTTHQPTAETEFHYGDYSFMLV